MENECTKLAVVLLATLRAKPNQEALRDFEDFIIENGVDAKSIGFNGEEAMQLMMKAGYDVTGDDICEVVTLDENDVVLLVDDPEDVPIGAYLPKLYPSLDLDLAGLS